MPTTRNPHHGSLQYRPRKRAARLYPRIRVHTLPAEPKLAGFAGYKVGMTHVLAKDNRKKSMSVEDVAMSVTVVECPPLRVIAIKAYKKTEQGLQPVFTVVVKGTKELSRRLSVPKKDTLQKLAELEKQLDQYTDIRVEVQTQPVLVGFGKKRPEVFELAIGGGDVRAKLGYAKQMLDRDIAVRDVFKEGQQVDVYAVTKGKGFQGPVKRFGVSLRQHKSEKTKRGPGNLGPWGGNRSWTVAHAGQMGLHSRKERNKWLLRISETAEGINPRGGFLRYGMVKNSYILLKGSLPGASKRLIRIAHPARPDDKMSDEPAAISFVSVSSRQ
jgi:large subunit ribosomal protein L3